jgi:hypothetical protein
MASNIDVLNYYTKGKSIIRGSFPISTNDQSACNAPIIANPIQNQFIDEAKTDSTGGGSGVDKGCGCVNDYVKFWYPINGALDGGIISYSPSNTTGYSKATFSVSNCKFSFYIIWWYCNSIHLWLFSFYFGYKWFLFG